MDVETLIAALKNDQPVEVKAALMAVPDQREALVERVPAELDALARDLTGSNRENILQQAFWLAYVAGALQLSSTHATLVRLVQQGMAGDDEVWSDTITDDLPRLFADTYAGDVGPLRGLATDRTQSGFTRLAGATAMGILCWRGVIPRDQLHTFFEAMVSDALADYQALVDSTGDAAYSEDDLCTFATGLMMLAAFELSDPALKPIIWPMVASDLFAPWMVSVEELEAGFAKGADASNPWADVICADGNLWPVLQPWAFFDEVEGRASEDPLPLSYEPADGEDVDTGRDDWHDPLPWVPPEPPKPVVKPPKVGRNDPCPCGSGKKFKKCCGA